MKNIEQKAVQFLIAFMDAYRDEENRELDAFAAMEISDDVTEDFTAMLLAMKVMFVKVCGDDADLIDFTHILNKMAVQYIMEKGGTVQ